MRHPHHRAAHGSLSNDPDDPPEHRHTLYGALVGGPDALDQHVDHVRAHRGNEVALDYNAGLAGALAGLVTHYAPRTRGRSLDAVSPVVPGPLSQPRPVGSDIPSSIRSVEWWGVMRL